MPRTDEQIVEYMRYYRNTTDKLPALESLAATEGKTVSEILEILRKAGEPLKISAPRKMTKEKAESIKNDLRSGMKVEDTAKANGVSLYTVSKIKAAMVADGEDIPDHRYAAKKMEQGKSVESEQRQFEAYPGQIYDDPVAVPVEFRKSSEEVPKIVPIRPLNGFAALLAMQEFVSTIAEGGEITEAAAAGSSAHISFSFGGANYGLELKRLDN